MCVDECLSLSSSVYFLLNHGRRAAWCPAKSTRNCSAHVAASSDGVAKVLVYVGDLVPVLVLRIGIFKHPRGTLAFLLQDHGHTFGHLCHVRYFIEVT